MRKQPLSKKPKDESSDEEEVFDTEENPTTTVSAPYMSKGQRKRAERKETWLRKHDFQNYVKKANESVIDDFKMAAVKNSLADLQAQVLAEQEAQKNARKSSTGNTSRKQREEIVKREQAQFDAVVNFQPFQENPFAALQAHLSNTLAAPEAPKKDKKKAKK